MKMLITGSSGLIGSEAVKFFHDKNHDIVGVDNNFRECFFGPEGNTRPTEKKLKKLENYKYYNLDIAKTSKLFKKHQFDVIIHCAGQPSHDKSAEDPLRDFKINALSTVKLLENTRKYSPNAIFIFCSTNKVYGDSPNYCEMEETPTRFIYKKIKGINENLTLGDMNTIRTPFGVSKLSADLAVQEYGRYFNLKTGVFRLGCVTGKAQKGVELHGFLNYLCKCSKENKEFTIYGYKGKQVRDIIHASDVANAFYNFIKIAEKTDRNSSQVFNLGGGTGNSCSILEAIDLVNEISGKKLTTKYCDQERKGDHILYITDFQKFKFFCRNWIIKKDLKSIIEELLK